MYHQVTTPPYILETSHLCFKKNAQNVGQFQFRLHISTQQTDVDVGFDPWSNWLDST